MTPYGKNVSDECNEASEKYINTLNSVKSNLQKYNSKVKKDILSKFQPLTLANQDDQWAYKMYDASAKRPKTGVLSGKLHYPGNFKQYNTKGRDNH